MQDIKNIFVFAIQSRVQPTNIFSVSFSFRNEGKSTMFTEYLAAYSAIFLKMVQSETTTELHR